MRASLADRMVASALGVATFLQGVLLVRLADLQGGLALQTLVVAGAVGLVVQQAWRYRGLLSHRVDMALVMLAGGGLGMVIGWWIDLTLSPGQLHGCCGGGGSVWRSVFSWMTGLMLLGAIPPSLVLTRCARLARGNPRLWVSTHLLGNAAMVAAMIAGGRLFGRTFGVMVGSPVVGGHLAMVIGMVLGMVAGMWLGEALLGLRPWRSQPVPPVVLGREDDDPTPSG